MSAPQTLTSNQYYGGLNRRFVKRQRRLLSIGFKYVPTEHGAMFIRPARYYVTKKMLGIPAALLHHADNRAFWDVVQWQLT